MRLVGRFDGALRKNKWHMSVASFTIVGIIICARAFIKVGRYG
jgi:hypothetical protein